ncbi:MAG: hypothetical protein ACYS30_25340 [Planctomycetota bacterium]|jgi:hypothetical protein
MQIMKLDYLNYLKEKKEVVSVVLLGISAFLAVLILIKAGSFFAASARAQRLVKMAIAQNNTDAKDMEKHFAESKAIATELKRENLFAPPPPKQHPVKEVWGIFGDEVLIKDKWYKVGDTVGDAKIVAIGPTSVKIEWDGKEKVFAPIDAVVASPPGGPKRGEPAKEAAKAGAETVSVQLEVRPMFGRGDRGRGGPGGRPGFGGGFDAMRERLQNMSEAERQRFMAERRERFQNMSEAERDRFRAEMRERFGGGQGGGRGPGGRR